MSYIEMLLTGKVHHKRLNNKSMAVVNTKCVICNDAEKNLSITLVNTKVNNYNKACKSFYL